MTIYNFDLDLTDGQSGDAAVVSVVVGKKKADEAKLAAAAKPVATQVKTKSSSYYTKLDGWLLRSRMHLVVGLIVIFWIEIRIIHRSISYFPFVNLCSFFFMCLSDSL